MKEIIIDCSGLESPRQLHQILAEKLEFPQWYGCNLDALHDLLTALTEETSLTLLHLDALGRFSIGFHRVLEDSRQENPHFQITFL